MGKYVVFYLPTEEGIEVVQVIQRARDIAAVWNCWKNVALPQVPVGTPVSARQVLATLEEIVAQGRTVVITTHDSALGVGGSVRFRMVAGRLERVE